MDEYLLDRETLGKFIDELMKQRTLPVGSAEELTKYREEQMRILDNSISQALIGGLNSEQAAELNTLLDNEAENPDVFQQFFERQGINVEQVITNAMESFGRAYLGGAQNA